jgi:two-component system, cell cycle sensor histidine kinase and response regulator CckA
MAPLRILMAEDLASDAELEERELRRAGLTFVTQRVDTRETFVAALAAFQPDIILSDYRMPVFDGMEALALVWELAPGTPLIIVTGSAQEETAVECLKAGAVDYVLKGHLGRLAPAVRAALEQRRAAAERRKADAALQASELRYRSLFENAGDAIMVADAATGTIVNANRRALDLTGRSLDELRTMRQADLAPPELADVARAGFQSMARGERTTEPRIPIRHRDGHVTPVEISTAVIQDEAGRTLLVGVFRDLSERERAEAERALLGAALDQAAELVVITDTTGAIEYVNPAFEHVTGWTRAEVMGQNPRILKSGVQAPDVYADAWATLTAGGVVNTHFVNRRKDGSHYEAEVVIFPVRDPAGRITQYVGLQRDVSHEYELAEQLRQSQKMESLGQMTGGITHDFNNLLGVILANAALVRPQIPAGDPDGTRFVEDLTEAAHRASAMVRKLLAFSRRERLSLQPVALGPALHEAAGTLRHLLPENIRVDVATVGEGHTVSADPGAVEQILLNLATNARDAMPDGGTLSIRAKPWTPASPQEAAQAGLVAGASYTAVAVTDSGAGMDAATAARAMEPFFTTKARGEGTGLGLAMVYGLMRQQGGHVTLASRPGAGTTVRLIFRSGRPSVTQAERPAEGEVPRGSGTILVVEDQTMLRRAICEVLHRLGYVAIACADGLEALDVLAARSAEIRLVLSDLVMPRMGGVQLHEQMRERGHAIPLILMSGYAADSDEAALPPGVPLIEKPWTAETLGRQVSAVLGARGAP